MLGKDLFFKTLLSIRSAIRDFVKERVEKGVANTRTPEEAALALWKEKGAAQQIPDGLRDYVLLEGQWYRITDNGNGGYQVTAVTGPLTRM